MKILSVALVASAMGVLLFGQTPSVINRNGKWPPFTTGANSYGGPYEVAYQQTPTALTALNTKDTHIIGYCVSNSTGGSITFTIQTKDASPLPLPLTGVIPALGSPGSSACFNAPFGLLSKGGISVQASATGLYFNLVWTN